MTMKLLRSLAAVAFTTVALFSPVQAETISPAQKTEIEGIIRSYLLENPELVREMVARLEEKDKQSEEDLRSKALVTFKDQIYHGKSDPIVGNPKGDVVVVEFMDYNCGYCKKAIGEVAQLMETDKNLKVIFKDFPIFGEHSEYAARAAIASNKQGKYWDLHKAMLSHEGQITSEQVDQLAAGLGLDMTRLKADIGSKEVGEQMAANMQLAKDLALSGTPAFLFDTTVVPGYLPLDGMQQEIAKVRIDGCKMC
jgi:protein-disulfide isomerase